MGGGIGGIAGRTLDGRSVFGQIINEGDFGHTLASATAGGIANAATRSAINGESFGKNLEAAIPDIIGQAVGGAIGGALTGPSGPANLLAGTPYENVDPAKVGDIAASWSDPVIQQPGAQVTGNVVAAGQGNSTGQVASEIVVTGRRGGKPYLLPTQYYEKPSELDYAIASGLVFARDPYGNVFGKNGLEDEFDTRTPTERLADYLGIDRRSVEQREKDNQVLDPKSVEQKARDNQVLDPENVIVVNGIKPGSFSKDDLELAYLAKLAYSLSSRGVHGYQRVSGGALSELGLSSGNLFNENTGFKAAVFLRGDEVVLAFAGTDGVDWADWRNNAQNEMNLLSNQHRQAIEVAEILVEENPDLTIRFTGHSLGGGLASLASAATGMSATTFNPGGISSALLGRLNLTRTDGDFVRAISHRADPLGDLQVGSRPLPHVGILDAPLGNINLIGSNVVLPFGAHGISHVIRAFINDGVR